jgi:hypothetical protein
MDGNCRDLLDELSKYLYRGNEQTHETLQSGQLITRQRFKTHTFQIEV